MPDYSKGKIYTIRCCSNPEHIYVGSTTQSLNQRWGGHKKMSKRSPNILVYSTINNDWDNWFIELYEEYPCENREQLNRKEGEVIRLLGTLNKRIEGRTKTEYLKDNSEHFKELRKQYYQDNAEYIKEQKKQYRKDNIEVIKEKAKQYHKDNAEIFKEKAKQYRQDNAEVVKEREKQYYKDNAEVVKERRKQYYQDNAKVIKERIKQYQQANKDIINERMKQYYQRKKLEKNNIVVN